MSGLFAKAAGRLLGLATLAGAAVVALGTHPAAARDYWRHGYYYDRPVVVATTTPARAASRTPRRGVHCRVGTIPPVA